LSLVLVILAKIVPIFLVMAAGFVAFSARWMDEGFVRTANQITFRIALPSLVFLSVAHADFSRGAPLAETVVFTVALGIATAVGYAISAILRFTAPRRASFVQGAIRGNLAIVALAVFQQVLGPSSIPRAALYLAFFMLIHNLVGIIVLSDAAPAGEETQSLLRRLWKTLFASLANPLMIAIYLGIIVDLTHLPLPRLLEDAFGYLGQLALPLALLGIGGAMKEYSRARHLGPAFAASVIKLLVMPAVALGAGLLLHLSMETLLMVVVFAGSPAAVATYSLADGMGADRDTAGSIVMVSHALCILTITAFIVIVRTVAS